MAKSVKIINYLILAGILLVPFLVLIVPTSLFFPFITGKNFSFRILTEIIFGLWIILAILDKTFRPKKSWILFAVTAFTFVLILSTIFSVNPYRSFWSNYERMEGLVTFLHLLALFLVMNSVMNRGNLWKWFFHTSLGVSIITAVYGLLQMAGTLQVHQGGTRLDATLGNSSYLAIYMIFHVFLALMLFFREREWYRWFYLPVAVLDSLILYQTATRGAILGFVGGLFIFAIIIVFFSAEKKIKIFTAGILALFIILMGSFWIFRTSNFVTQSPVLSRFSSISFQETTTQSRLVVWQMAWQGFKERPVLGWGLENFNLIFNKNYQPILWKQEPWFDRAHNVFLDRLTTNGILGLATYLSLFFCALYCLWIKRKSLGFSVYDSAILTSMFAAYFFHNLFVFDNLISLILFYSVLAYISYRSRPMENLPKTAVIINGAKSAYIIIVAIAMVFTIYFINVPALLACHDLLAVFNYARQGDVETAFQKFQKSISYNSFGRAEAREQITSFAGQIIQQAKLDQNFKIKVYDYAVSEMKKQIEQSPNDIRNMIFLGVLYNKGNQYDDAVAVINKAIELSPKKQQLYFELTNAYLNKKEYDKALEASKTAFELDSDFVEVRKIYALAAIFAGKDDLASDLMKDYGGLIIPDERFINAFIERKQISKVVAVWEKLLETDPNNAQYHVSLAASYLQVGRREEAIKQLQKAMEIEPKFKQQGEYYINEIKAGRNP